MPVATRAPSVRDIKDTVRRSIIRVRNLGCGVEIGSGVAIDEDHFVTNAHVVEGPGPIQVNLWNGELREGRVERASAQRDLAIVRVGGLLSDWLAPRAADPPQLNDRVYIAGFPLGKKLELTRGTMIGTERVLGYTSYALDAPIVQGNSGGPAVDEDGTIVGIVNMKNVIKHRAYAIPIADVTRLRGGGIAGVEQVRCGESRALLEETP